MSVRDAIFVTAGGANMTSVMYSSTHEKSRPPTLRKGTGVGSSLTAGFELHGLYRDHVETVILEIRHHPPVHARTEGLPELERALG